MKRALPVVLSGMALVMSTTLALAAGAVTRVSGPSPYAGCTAGAGTGKIYVNTEVEPYVAVNPANPKTLVATWQQDRWSNGGAHGGASASSADGGRSWTETTLPLSSCAPGAVVAADGKSFLRASDFWVSFGPDGTAYASGLPFDLIDGRNGVANATSRDGGLTWHHAQMVYFSATNQFSADKNSVTANPVQPRVAYTVWDVLVSATDNPDDNPHTGAYNGDAYFSGTTDGGVTWGTPKVIFPTSNRNQTIGNVVVVDSRNGGNTLYDFANYIVAPNSASNTQQELAFVKSTDGGATWSAPQVVTQMFTKGVHDPNTGALLRVGDGIPSVTIDPATGQIYAAWEDSTQFKKGDTSSSVFDDEISMVTSTDGGASWTAPLRVSNFSGQPVFTPSLAVDTGGRVGLTYYDARNLTAGNTTTMPVDYWFNSSTDHGATFGAERHVAGSFNILAAPYARGYFLGDYMGLASSGRTFVAAFAATNCTDNSCSATANPGVNAQDIFVATGL